MFGVGIVCTVLALAVLAGYGYVGFAAFQMCRKAGKDVLPSLGEAAGWPLMIWKSIQDLYNV